MASWTTVQRGPGKLGGFTRQGVLQGPSSSAFYGSKSRRAAKAAATGTNTKMPLSKGFRANHITARPAALGRYNSLAMFNGAEKTGFYSPFQMAASFGGKQVAKSSAFRTAVYGSDAALAPETQVFQRGMVSMMTAGRKIDRLESKAASRVVTRNGLDTTVKGSSRAARKVATAQEQVRRLAMMNNPGLLNAGTTGVLAPGKMAQGSFMGKALAGDITPGLTGNLMASAGKTEGSRFVQGYVRGTLGHAGTAGLTGEALSGANKALSHMTTALGGDAVKAANVFKQGAFKTLGTKGVFQAAATKQGAMALGARAGMMAIPGLNLLATASLVYDLGKMGGEVVKSGINLAKDAVKSMKGSIDKPMFGMGYKDNEVAATSRARGVAAIQNSRLNARSALGSEGAMMASHFG